VGIRARWQGGSCTSGDYEWNGNGKQFCNMNLFEWIYEARKSEHFRVGTKQFANGLTSPNFISAPEARQKFYVDGCGGAVPLFLLPGHVFFFCLFD
jgi:hypothetical protein